MVHAGADRSHGNNPPPRRVFSRFLFLAGAHLTTLAAILGALAAAILTR